MSTVVIIGGGHNGLVAAFYLAKAGLKPLVLERRSGVGGGAITGEVHPGFRCPTLAHATGPIAAKIVRDLQLASRGVRFVDPLVRVFAPSRDGPPLLISREQGRTRDSIRQFSSRDADQYPEFVASLTGIAAFLSGLLTATPPSIETPSGAEIWRLLATGLKFRQLGKANAHRLLRWGPMAVADLVGEWFDCDLLRAVLAAPGIAGAMFGPSSAGSGALLLLQCAVDTLAHAPHLVQGGPGALTYAMADAAREAGAEIRTDAQVREIAIDDGVVHGVELASGERIDARAVISSADPRRTFLSLIDPVHLTPDFLMKMRNYRARGVLAKVNLALAALPTFRGLVRGGDRLSHPLAGRIHIGPGLDYLERAFDAAKYGRYSDEPYLDVMIPSLIDPSLAPDGAHVMSVYVQYAPFQLRESDWNREREPLGDLVVRTLADYAPDLPRLVVSRQVITPADLDTDYGFTGGHIHHGEMAIDQLFTMRPLLGWGQYATPISGLFLCGGGTHPGGTMTGLPGRNASREVLKALR